ncbi:MAG: 50S ribosomal protein L3 [Rhodospirillales bacterium]|nr:50S ribosomal protein L3 [Rhodospirillales bacterium]USO06967.1 MAG: 50S ribosomal protein L3 [Rhodospirillales bacterium]
MRTGLIARKEGMSRYFDSEGRHVPVTILKVEGLQVTAVRTQEKDGYTAVQLGAGKPKVKNLAKAQRESFAKTKIAPKAKMMEFRIDPKNMLEIGAELSVAHFIPGQFVDCQGISTGKGFAGAMKRWNFGGLRATHGVSVSHRSHGSTGNRQDPGRTFPGKKMAGHLGAETVTTQNLKIVAVDEAEGLILIQGSVPGHKGAWVSVCDAVKKPMPKDAPLPAGLKANKEVSVNEADQKTEQPAAEAQTADVPAAEPKSE